MKKKWKENRNDLVLLPYIQFLNVPMRSSKYGPVIEVNLGVIEVLAAKAVIENRIPLRGLEVKFLRKTLGYSLEKFANKLGLTSGTVFHWEKDQDKRLMPVNEAAVRASVAEELGLEISGKFSQLLGDQLRELKIQAR